MATILVVEDEPAVRSIIASVLVDLQGHACVEAKHGREALQQLERNDIDVIYTNLAMPVMDGDAFLARLSPGLRQRVPCILGSGLFPREYWKTLIGLRLVDLVRYPIDIYGLMACFDWAVHLRRSFRGQPLDLDGTDVEFVCRLVREAHWAATEHPYFGRAARAAYADTDLPVLREAAAWAARHFV